MSIGGAPRTCAGCGGALGPGARFCRSCGTQIGSSPLQDACGQCGHANPPGSRFCRSCGGPLPERQAADAPGVSQPAAERTETQRLPVAFRPGAPSRPLQTAPLAFAPGALPPPQTARLASGDVPVFGAVPHTQQPGGAGSKAAAGGRGRRAALTAVAVAIVLAVAAGAAIFLLRKGPPSHDRRDVSAQVHSRQTQPSHGEARPQGEATSGTAIETTASTSATSTSATSTSASGTSAGTSATGTSAASTSAAGTPTTGSANDSEAHEGRARSPASGDAAASSRGPSLTMRQHLEDLGDGEYEAAFNLMSAAYRDENSDWPTIREEADPTIQIVTVDAPSVIGNRAYVYVDFYAKDSYPTRGSDTGCREFKGTAELVRGGTVWQYEPLGDNLKSSLQPNPDCED